MHGAGAGRSPVTLRTPSAAPLRGLGSNRGNCTPRVPSRLRRDSTRGYIPPPHAGRPGNATDSRSAQWAKEPKRSEYGVTPTDVIGGVDHDRTGRHQRRAMPGSRSPCGQQGVEEVLTLTRLRLSTQPMASCTRRDGRCSTCRKPQHLRQAVAACELAAETGVGWALARIGWIHRALGDWEASTRARPRPRGCAG